MDRERERERARAEINTMLNVVTLRGICEHAYFKTRPI